MSANLLGELVNASIFIFGGLYARQIGTRRVGKPFGVSADYVAWHERFGKAFALGGPLVMMYGVGSFLVVWTSRM